jgi:glycerol-3-phosphate cytidylyltransferase
MKRFKLGLTFGSINPLHYGHVLLIKNAKEYVDKLYFGLDSDDYLINIKNKPLFQPFNKRYEILNEIKGIDLIFKQEVNADKEFWINKFKPDCILVGDDHRNTNWEGELIAKKYNIPVIYIPHTKELHSKDIRNLIKEN